MLRIHFTSDDLARLTVARAADPLWEVLLSRFRLHEENPPLAYRPWLRTIRGDHAVAIRMRPAASLLATLAPKGPYFPDFFTPAEAGAGLEPGLDALLRTPRKRLRHELRQLVRIAKVPLPDWARSVAEGDVQTLTRLGDSLRAYYNAGIAPQRNLIQRSIDADLARRACHLLEGGIEGLFAGLRPAMRWQPPVLEVDYAIDKDLYLQGRGLRLVPSYFCHRHPDSFADKDQPPVLVYPIDQELRWQHIATTSDSKPMAALMGTTRAAVLESIELAATTTQLARRLNTSAASISRHTTVLREAGLIATHRDGTAVVHTHTAMGAALLGNR